MDFKKLLDLLAAWFPRKTDPGFALSQIYSTYAMLNGARQFFWFGRNYQTNALNLVDYLGAIPYLVAGTPTRGTENLLCYGNFDGVDDFHWIGAPTNYTQFYNYLSFIAWVKFNPASLGAISAVFSRWRTATNDRSYYVRKTAADKIQFSVSGNGTTEISVTSTATMVADQWYFLAGQHTPSTELALWVSNPTTLRLDKDLNTTAIPADSFPTSAAEFNIGARNSAAGVHTDWLNGKIALLWLGGGWPLPAAQLNQAYQIARPLLGL